MPSHFSSIGFPIDTEDTMLRYVQRAAAAGEPVAAEHGAYVRWTAGCGAELWVQIDCNRRVVGLNPHFSGDAFMRVRLTERIARSEDSPLDGAFYGWANPYTDEPESGDYPFVFDTPDYDVYRSLQLPIVLDVQVAAFAHELTGYINDEEFYAATSDEIKLAAESFIPAGLFSLRDDVTVIPQAHAIFNGHVLSTSLLMNELTGARFYWAKVRTLGGEVDLVAEPSVLAGSLAAGGVVSGSFWLSGRLLNYPQSKDQGVNSTGDDTRRK